MTARGAAIVVALLAFIGCDAQPSEVDAQLVVTGGGPPGAVGVVHLYGVGDQCADCSATLVVNHHGPLLADGKIEVPMPEDPASLIDENSRGGDNVFYFVTYVDLDGDSEVCGGVDLMRDYDVDPYVSSTQIPSTLVHHMEPIPDAFPCWPVGGVP